MKDKKINIITVVFFFILVWGYYFVVSPYHLVFKEQITLFMMRESYIFSFLDKPAFIARIAGDFLTQFFIVPAGAASVMVLLLILGWFGIKKSLQNLSISKNVSLLAILSLIPEVFLATIVEYPCSMTVGFVLSIWAFAACSSVKNTIIRGVITSIISVSLYPLLGGHFLVFLILFVFKERRSPFFVSAISAITLISVFVFGRMYLLTPYQTLFFPIIEGYMFQNPYLFLVTEVTIILSVVFGKIMMKSCLLFGFIALYSILFPVMTYEGAYEYDLKISSQAYFGNWKLVAELGDDNKYETVSGAYYRNIALSREGRLAYDLLHGYQPLYHGLFIKVKEDIGYFKVISSVDALMECGDMAQAQHSALLGMTFTPNQQSSRMARRLAEIAVANGDFTAAEKYFNMLEYTLFHRKWAKEAILHIENNTFTPLDGRSDILFSPNDYYRSLKNIIESDPNNIKALDYLLCFNLMNKELDSFRANFDLFFRKTNINTLPELYQEALIMTFKGEELSIERLKQYNISPKIFEQCLDYNRIYESTSENVMKLLEKYRDTYWFYYYFAQEGKE